MLELNGLKYSKERFNDYKNRAIAVFEKQNEWHKLDVYTTDTDKDNLIKVLKSIMKDGVDFIQLDHWCSKEQDDRCSEMLDEWLNEA